MELKGRKERSAPKIVKNLKLLREYMNRATIAWFYVPLTEKIDECIYGEHTDGSLFIPGNIGRLNLNRTKERSAPKIVKNLKSLREEVQQYKQTMVVKKFILDIDTCLYGEYILYRKPK